MTLQALTSSCQVYMAVVTLMESQSILLSTLITQLLYVASEQIQNSNDF